MLNSELIALLQQQPQDLEVEISVPVYEGDWEGEETWAPRFVYVDPTTNRITVSG